MRIGTAEPGSTFLAQGKALKQLLDQRGVAQPVEVVTALSASIENAQNLENGAIQFGFMASNWIGRVIEGVFVRIPWWFTVRDDRCRRGRSPPC
jgi:TRAP-type uncharacterized transport system substrate-binding protein